MDAAQTLWQRDGLHAVSVNSVAKEAGVAKGTIYLYFKHKEDILANLTLQARETLLDTFKEATGRVKSAPEKLLSIFSSYMEFNDKYPLYGELITYYQSNGGLEETPILAQASFAISNHVNGIVEKGIEDGSLRKDLKSASVTYAMWGASAGMMQLVQQKADLIEQYIGCSAQEVYFEFAEVIVRGMRANVDD